VSMLPDNLGFIFNAALKLAPQLPAVLQDETVITFEELDARCNRMANALWELGVRAGDRVALMFSNDYRFLESLFGPMRLGAVSVPLNIKMGDEALAYVIADSEAQVLIANQALADRARALADRLPSIRHLIAAGPQIDGTIEYESFLQTASPLPRHRKTDPDEICLQPYTSGSTGKPKGVLLAHGGQIWNADMMRKAKMLDHTERALIAVPLFHKNAMAGAVKPFLLAGGSIVILPGFNAIQVIQSIERYRVTYLTGVPAMYKMILAEKEALAQADVSSIRYAMCGSAEVPEALLEEFQSVFQAPISEGYGLTEGGPVPLTNTRWGLKKRGSCGRAMPDSKVKIVGDDGVTELGPNQIGELVTCNPGVAKGYWKLPEITAVKFRDGWLHTGDLMRCDEDGYYYFIGRKDDMISVAGENVYPKEVEDLLLQHPNVADAVVVPVNHDLKGAVPVAFIIEREKGAATEEEIKQFFLQRGAPYAHPRRVYFFDALPLGGTGKVDRGVLKRIAHERMK
ncbi:MAG: class I adenylate-forming enzyme family protein, partial [Pyrinomonadaceae bacterium]